MPVVHQYNTVLNLDLPEQNANNILNDKIRCMTYAGGDWSELVYYRNNGGVGNGQYITRSQTWAVGNNINVTDVQIDIQNGPTLRGQLSEHTNNSRGFYVVFFSGSGGPSQSYAPSVVQGYLLDPDIANFVKGVLTVDYRGFGRSSTGTIDNTYVPAGSYKPEEQGTYTDARAMVDFLVSNKNINANRIILHGYSLGAGPATQLAAEGAPHAGLILQGPMESVGFNAKKVIEPKGLRLHSSNSMAQKVIWGIVGLTTAGVVPGIVAALGAGVSKVSSNSVGYKSNEKIANINSPCLISSGPNDSMWEDAKSLWKRRKNANLTTYISTHDGTHFEQGRMFGNDTPYKPDKYSRADAKTILKMFFSCLP